jgi:TRAP-type C4-dicarboxylate transport system substrate-binding protein
VEAARDVPIQLAWTETYLGIRQGVVNAVTAPLSLVRSMKFTEVAPFIIEIRNTPDLADHDQRTDLEEAFGRRTATSRPRRERSRHRLCQDHDGPRRGRRAAMIRDNKAEVVKLDTEAMRAKLQPLYAELIKEKALSKELYDAVNALPR